MSNLTPWTGLLFLKGPNASARDCCGWYYPARLLWGLCKCVTVGVGVSYYNEESRRVPGVAPARQGTLCHDNRHKGEETPREPRWHQSCKLSNYCRMHRAAVSIVKYFWHNCIMAPQWWRSVTVFLLPQMQKTKPCPFMSFNRYEHVKMELSPWILFGKVAFLTFLTKFPLQHLVFTLYSIMLCFLLVWLFSVQLLDLPCPPLKDDICLCVKTADGQCTLSSVLLSGVWHKCATGHGNQARLTSTPPALLLGGVTSICFIYSPQQLEYSVPKDTWRKGGGERCCKSDARRPSGEKLTGFS